jgi:hypothetical protein
MSILVFSILTTVGNWIRLPASSDMNFIPNVMNISQFVQMLTVDTHEHTHMRSVTSLLASGKLINKLQQIQLFIFGNWSTVQEYIRENLEAWIAQWYNAGLWVGWSGVRVPAGNGNFSPQHRVQNGSGIHPASYPRGTKVSFPGGKVAGAWSWPFTSIQCRGQERVELHIHSPIRLHGVVLS